MFWNEPLSLIVSSVETHSFLRRAEYIRGAELDERDSLRRAENIWEAESGKNALRRENGFLYERERLSLIERTAYSGRENGFLSGGHLDSLRPTPVPGRESRSFSHECPQMLTNFHK